MPDKKVDVRVSAAAKIIFNAGKIHGWFGALKKDYDALDPIGREELDGIVEQALNAADATYTYVFLLWHTNPKNEDEKLIGVYSTKENAENARATVTDQVGFRDSPEGFEICPYALNTTAWTDGFVSWDEV